MDKSQIDRHGLHHETNREGSALPHADSLPNQKQNAQDAELDALEEKLFAMAKSR